MIDILPVVKRETFSSVLAKEIYRLHTDWTLMSLDRRSRLSASGLGPDVVHDEDD